MNNQQINKKITKSFKKNRQSQPYTYITIKLTVPKVHLKVQNLNKKALMMIIAQLAFKYSLKNKLVILVQIIDLDYSIAHI